MWLLAILCCSRFLKPHRVRHWNIRVPQVQSLFYKDWSRKKNSDSFFNFFLCFLSITSAFILPGEWCEYGYRVCKLSIHTQVWFGMQLCGQPWRSTTSALTLFESVNTYMIRPPMQSSSTAEWESGYEQKLDSHRVCLLSPTLFNTFLERIMTCFRQSWRHCQQWRWNNQCPLCWWPRWLSRRGRTCKKLEHLDKTSTAYNMEISAEKTKLMINNTRGIN